MRAAPAVGLFSVVERRYRSGFMVASAVIDSLALRDSSLRCVAEASVVLGDLYDGEGGILYGAVSISCDTGSIRLLSHTTYESRPLSSTRFAYTIAS